MANIIIRKELTLNIRLLIRVGNRRVPLTLLRLDGLLQLLGPVHMIKSQTSASSSNTPRLLSKACACEKPNVKAQHPSCLLCFNMPQRDKKNKPTTTF